MKKLIAVMVLMLLVCGSAFADIADMARQSTADLSGIKAVSNQQQVQPQAKTYEIPLYQTLQKKDGSGEIDVLVGSDKTTKAQLERQIQMGNKQLENIQKRVTELQAQLDKINELEK